MSDRLPLPPEMQHLIEKRSGEERRGSDSEPESAGIQETGITPAEEKTGSVERRTKDRRSEE